MRNVSLLWLAVMGGAACAPVSGSTVCAGDGALLANETCQPREGALHHLPFRAGFEARVVQAFHGYTSHVDNFTYAVDFKCEKGETIVATRDGIVWDLRKTSTVSCLDKSCIDKANFVVIDHGDGTFSEYHHLRHRGVVVTEGQQVCRGQAIGICGNTGFSRGSHLHYALTGTTRQQALPVRFVEARETKSFGFPIPEATYRSANERQFGCRPTQPSVLGAAAFAHHGIILDHDLGRHFRRSAPTRIRGRYFGDHPQVALHRQVMGSGPWYNQCFPVDEDGTFDIVLSWPEKTFPAGRYWLMVTGSSQDCDSPGWPWSYRAELAE